MAVPSVVDEVLRLRHRYLWSTDTPSQMRIIDILRLVPQSHWSANCHT
jgi:hypothetical protein